MKNTVLLLMRHLRELGCVKAILVYVVLICAVYSPVVFYGRTLSMAERYPWFESFPPEREQVVSETYSNTFNVDIASPAAYEEPIDAFIGKFLRQGVYPLWNPYIGCGTIIQESFSTRSLFPYQLLQNIFPWSWRDFFLLARLLFAALGVFIFLRTLGADYYPSLAGGVLYGLSGAMTVFLTLTQMSNVSMTLPYLLIGAELLCRKQSVLRIFLCSAALAVFLLGGQPEVAFYGVMFMCFYYLIRMGMVGSGKRALARKSVGFLVALCLGFVIASPFFVPFLLNSRHYYTLHPPGGTQGVESPTHLESFAAIILPQLLRWRTPVYAFTSNYGWDRLGGYIGIVAFFLGIAGLKEGGRGRRMQLFFLGFGLCILLKNAGVPPVSWVGRLPFFDQVWTPRWAGPVWNLSVVLAASLGFQALVSGGSRLAPIVYAPLPDFRLWRSLFPIFVEGFVLFVGVVKKQVAWDLLARVSIRFGINAVSLWNATLLLLMALGVVASFLLLPKKETPQEAWPPRESTARAFSLIMCEMLLLAISLFLNLLLWIVLTGGENQFVSNLPDSTKNILRIFCIVMSCIVLLRSARKFSLEPPFTCLLFIVAVCLFCFQAQAQQVEGDYFRHFVRIGNASVMLSVWQAITEALFFGIATVVTLFFVWKWKDADRSTFTLLIVALIMIELSFYVTLGYSEWGRLLRFLIHLVALSAILLLSLSRGRGSGFFIHKITIGVVCLALLAVGVLGAKGIPPRSTEPFRFTYLSRLPRHKDTLPRLLGIRGVLFPNSASAVGIFDVKSISSISIYRFQLFQEYCLLSKPQFLYDSLWLTGTLGRGTKARPRSSIVSSLRERYPFYALAGVTEFLSTSYEDIPYTKLWLDGPIKHYRNLAVLPRAFVVCSWSFAKDPEEALRWMLDHRFSLGQEAVIEGSPALFPPEQPVAYSLGKEPSPAKIISAGLHSIVLEAYAPAAGILVFTDTYHPDWQAKVDGELQQVFPADLCFRGVFLKPGKHIVEFRYFPKAFYACLVVSLMTAFVMGVVAYCQISRRYKEAQG